MKDLKMAPLELLFNVLLLVQSTFNIDAMVGSLKYLVDYSKFEAKIETALD